MNKAQAKQYARWLVAVWAEGIVGSGEAIEKYFPDKKDRERVEEAVGEVAAHLFSQSKTPPGVKEPTPRKPVEPEADGDLPELDEEF